MPWQDYTNGWGELPEAGLVRKVPIKSISKLERSHKMIKEVIFSWEVLIPVGLFYICFYIILPRLAGLV